MIVADRKFSSGKGITARGKWDGQDAVGLASINWAVLVIIGL